MAHGFYLILSLVVAVAFSSELQYRSGPATIHAGHPVVFTIDTHNWRVRATLKLEHNHNVSVCVVRAGFQLPWYTQYSSDICTFFANWTNNETSVDLDLRYSNYTVGVYFSNWALNKTNVTVSWDVVGDVCDGELNFWDPMSATCIAATHIKDWNSTLENESFHKRETKFFYFDNPERVGHFQFQTTQELNLVSYARWNAGPAVIHDSVEGKNGTILVSSPKPGRWVFYVHAAEALSNVTIRVTGEVCPENRGGHDCQLVVHDAANDANLTATVGSTSYFRVLVNRTHGLLVSVTTANSTLLPQLWASRGQIPTATTADIKNCNGKFCDVVRSIAYNMSNDTAEDANTVEEWYIAVSSSGSTNTQYAIWFGTPCIFDCEVDNHGVCRDDGKCDCEIDFTGINCATSKGLGPQYIVLIIIASLVVASAVIGFVAWAYMRRKRANYEILS